MRAVGDAAVDAGCTPAADAEADAAVAAEGSCSKFALIFDGLAVNCSGCGDAAADDESANRFGLSRDRMPT